MSDFYLFIPSLIILFYSKKRKRKNKNKENKNKERLHKLESGKNIPAPNVHDREHWSEFISYS